MFPHQQRISHRIETLLVVLVYPKKTDCLMYDVLMNAKYVVWMFLKRKFRWFMACKF